VRERLILGDMVCPICAEAVEENADIAYSLATRRYEEAHFSFFLVHQACLKRVAHPRVTFEDDA